MENCNHIIGYNIGIQEQVILIDNNSSCTQ